MSCQRVIRQGGTVLTEAFNTDSKRWDPRCPVQPHATIWEGVIHENRLEIGNHSRPTLPWNREVKEGESVIDQMLANQPIVRGPYWAMITPLDLTMRS
jgi:hypothetical protein